MLSIIPWGGTYFPSPESLLGKGVLNIKNEKDSYCFAYSILASIHLVGNKENASSSSKYKPYMRELNLKGLKFPLIDKDVKRFERQNSTISVNILQWTENQALPLQVTEYRDRPHHVNLLLLHNNKTSKSYYTLVRDLSRLVFGRTKACCKAYVCLYCLYCFTNPNLLKNHIPECSIHPVQKITFPEPKDNEDVDFDILHFKNIHRTLPVPFALYCDFDYFLVPVKVDDSTSNTKTRELHQPSGFVSLRVAQVPEHNGKLFTYSGGNVMTVFYEHLKDQEAYIREFLSEKLPMNIFLPKS